MQALRRWRADWRYPTTLLCVSGFFSTVKPLEPFLIPYLTGPDKNLTTEQVNNEVFPVWTYSYLSVLVPVFLLTDWLRYKPVVVFQCASLFATTAMICWVEGVPAMQAMEFVYGVATACEVAYFSYIYSVVDLKRYRMATSYARSVQLLGYTVGSVLGQLLVSFDLMSYNNILIFTLVLITVAICASCLLPMPQRSMFFHRNDGWRAATDGNETPAHGSRDAIGDTGASPVRRQATGNNLEGGADVEESAGNGLDVKGSRIEHGESVGADTCGKVLLKLWKDFRRCYSSRELLYWSLWWALATCGYNQTVNYVQVLWEHVQPSQNFTIYNGGAATAYGIGFTEVRWEQWGELALGGFSGLGSAALFLMTFVGNIWVCYTGYVIFKSLYMLLITIAMYQIAADLTMERYALVFGANNFGALALQTVLTSVVVDSRGLGLGIIPQVSSRIVEKKKQSRFMEMFQHPLIASFCSFFFSFQFIVYASYFSVIAIVFLLRGIFTVWKLRRSGDSYQLT
ncbi:thiamine transporter 1 isoform X2 [Antennarius striatus]|uniref:thiamine transporter 1 isoform X2 n=1 Tax=Antennarius striatus TaxID=241820 RepID=UPI0035ADD3B9